MRSTNPGFVPDSPFTRELTAKQLAFFSAFPKAELHCHLLGTTSRETFIDLVRDAGAPISMAEIEGFYTRGEKPVGVLRIFRALESSILKKPEYLKRITLEHLERTAAQGVRYIELFWNWTGLKHFMTYAEGQDAIVAGSCRRLTAKRSRKTLLNWCVKWPLTALPGSSVWGSTTAKRSTNPKISGRPTVWRAMPALN